MGNFRIWKLIVFAVTMHLAAPVFYFLNKGKDRVQTYDLRYFDFQNVSKIVIDMIYPYYVSKVQDNDGWDTLSSDESHYPTAHLNFHWNLWKPKVKCTFSKIDGITCAEVTRLVVIEGKNIQFDLQVFGHNTYFERYIGCYEYKKVAKDDKSNDYLIACITFCETLLFAFTKGKECLCIEDTQDFNPVGLHSCNETCSEFQFCGGSGYFSIYRRIVKKTIEKQVSWECIYDEMNCSKCPEGRYGPNCENINCNLNNGDCGEMDCQEYIFKCRDCGCKTCNYSISMCVCRPGFYFYEELTDCREIDECLKIDACPENSHCIKLVGSYKCECDDGYYLAAGNLCHDMDECLTTTCFGEYEVCNNIIGSYSCDCLEGFEKSGGNNTCEDLDECLNNLDVCGNNSNCENSIGSYDCKCTLGYYETPEKICADVDECNSTTNCDKESTECKNLLGDYECLCKIGFVKGESKSPKSRCFDIDECKPSRCPDGVSCINSVGSYDCICPNGTTKKEYAHAMECLDIDECLEEGMCDETSSFCMNAFNYYICVCRVGYITVDNFTCIMTTAAKKVDLEEDTTSAVTTQSFDENESKSDVIPWLPFMLSFIVLFVGGALCLYISYSYSEQSFSFMSTVSSEFQSIG